MSKNGFYVFADPGGAVAGPSVQMKVDYPPDTRPEEVASAVTVAARKAFEEIEIRLGPLPTIEPIATIETKETPK